MRRRPRQIPVWTSCSHGDGTYITRFGDECCRMCHEVVALLVTRRRG